MQINQINFKAITSLFALPCKVDHDLQFEKSMKMAADWLLQSQQVHDDGGYAHSFHFLYGWQKSYPETTGYIIPTMLDCAEYFGNQKYFQSAYRAITYILNIQQKDGSFLDLNGSPQVFDAGQILIGLNNISDRKTNLSPQDILNSIDKTSHWLLAQQRNDGAFVHHTYNNLPHAYYSRVGAALIKAGQVLNNSKYLSAGIKNIQWTLNQQLENGFFKYSSFNHELDQAYSHTMIYILEGLFEAHLLLKTQDHDLSNKCLQAILKTMNQIKKNLGDENIMLSEYDPEFNVKNKTVCATGLAQWSRMCFLLSNYESKDSYIDYAKTGLLFLKNNQYASTNENMQGGISGSIPFYGVYMKNSIPNWGQKFYIDALMVGLKLGVLS